MMDKHLDWAFFAGLSDKLLANYDKFCDMPNYPEDRVLEAITALDSAAYFIKTFDWEQHDEDMRNDYQEKE